jgi:predicted ester cyclase
MGAKPTGKVVVATGMNLFRLADGRIEEIWVEADDLGEMQQLGVVKLPE